MKRTLLPLLCITLAACSTPPGGTLPPATPPAASAEPAPPTAALPPHSASAATASASPSVSSAPATPSFQRIAEAPTDARLFAVEGALLLASETPQVAMDDGTLAGNPVGVLQGNTVVYPDALFLEGWFHRIVALEGRYPDNLHMLAIGDTGRTGVAEHWVLDAKRGWREKSAQVGSWYVGMARFGSSLLGLTAPAMWGTAEFVALSGPKVKPRLMDAKACPKDGEWQARGSTGRLLPAALTATSGGQLLAFGNDCLGPAALEIWKPGARTSSFLTLPAGGPTYVEPDSGVAFSAGTNDDAWLLASGQQLYHYRDGALSEVPLPAQKPCSTVKVAPNGVVWLLCSGRPFMRVAERWQEQSTEGNVELEDLAIDRAGTVWAVGGGSLLQAGPPSPADRTQPLDTTSTAPAAAAAPLAAPVSGAAPLATAAAPAQRRRLPRLGSPSCPNNLVILYGFTKTTPVDYDYPLTRKALRGHPEFAGVRFVVTRDVGRRFFVAMVPSYELGRQLQALIKTELQGSKPQLVCAEPEVEREVHMDLSPAPSPP